MLNSSDMTDWKPSPFLDMDKVDLPEATVHGNVEPEIDFEFYFTDIVFLVENCLFKVPRRAFEENSNIFRDMFAMPVPEGSIADGSSKEHPLHLVGILAKDFRALLAVMFPLHFSQAHQFPWPHWASVLKLATMWEFDDLRLRAIEEISNSNIDVVDKIVLAKSCEVTEWLLPALNVLARRTEPLKMKDVSRLGIEWALLVSHVRESFAARNRRTNSSCSYCRNGECYQCGYREAISTCDRSEFDFTSSIRTVFSGFTKIE